MSEERGVTLTNYNAKLNIIFINSHKIMKNLKTYIFKTKFYSSDSEIAEVLCLNQPKKVSDVNMAAGWCPSLSDQNVFSVRLLLH